MPSIVYRGVGPRIAYERRISGLTQADLARSAGTALGTVRPDGVYNGTAFGPDSVRIHEVSVAVSLRVFSGQSVASMGHNDAGGASRFFPVFRYEAKAPASGRPRGEDGTVHPTVKPLGLIRWLVRLVTPPGGIVLDPFTGSGTTLKVASLRRGHLARRTHICPENGPKARRRSGRLVCRKCDARAARTRCA